MALTTIYQLKTFADIYTAVREELKIQSTDTTAIQRIKRDINIVYLEEVIPFAQWKWLRGVFDATVYAAIQSGTASVTQGNQTVTLTTAIVSPKMGWLFGVIGYNEVYRIAAHSNSSGVLTLQVPYTGVTTTAAQYKVWTDEIYLPSFVRETFEISHDFQDQPLESCGLQKFRQYVAALPRAEGRPYFYTTNTYVDPIAYAVPSGMPAISTRASNTINKTLVFASDVSNYLQQGDRIRIGAASDPTYNGEFVVASQSGATITYTAMVPTYEATTAEATLVLEKAQPSSDTRRAKRIQVYPSIFNQNTTLHIDYIREAIGLADDTDEPLMPIGDRTILLYGALNRAWSRERNPEEAKRNFDLFSMKLTRMAGKMDDSIDQPKLQVSKIYLGTKRMAQRQKDTRNGLPEGWGGGSGGANVITNTANRAAIFDSTGSLAASIVLANSELIQLSGIGSQADGISDSRTLSNKTLIDASNSFAYVGDTTRKAKFSLGGATTATTATLAFIQTVSRTYTFPDITDTLVTLTSTATLSNKTLLDGSTVVANTSDTSKTFVWDLSAATASTRATLAFLQTANRTYTFPDATDTVALLAATQVFTNKTIASSANTIVGLTDATISSSAAIKRFKIAASSANWVVTNDVNGFLTGVAPGSSGNLLTSNGTIWQSTPAGVASYVKPTKQIFTSSSGTYTTPTSPAPIYLRVRIAGGGGGGGGCDTSAAAAGAGGGAGGGGYCEHIITSSSATYLYAVGSGGAGGAPGNNAGSPGGNTTFGTLLLLASGGGGGPGSGAAVIGFPGGIGGSGGSASGANIANIPGGGGGGGFVLSAGAAGSGNGGSSQFGSGGQQTQPNNPGVAGGNYGGGGAGGVQVANGGTQSGGAGAPGIIVVEEFYQ